MIVLLLVLYYIYIRDYIAGKSSKTRCVGGQKKAGGEFLLGFWVCGLLERSKLVSRWTGLLPLVGFGVGRLAHGGYSRKSRVALSVDDSEGCRYLMMVLDPSDLPRECVSEESERRRQRPKSLSDGDSSELIREHGLSGGPWRQELYRGFLEKIGSMQALERGSRAWAGLGEDLVGDLSGFKGRRGEEDYLDRLLDMSLRLKFVDKRCARSVNIRRLWEFGRLYCGLSGEGGWVSSGYGGSKYYREFLAFVYYRCIYGLEAPGSGAREPDLDRDDSFFEAVACYQLIPVLGIEGRELASLGGLCEWEFERKAFGSRGGVEQERLRLIRRHIDQVDEIYSKLDLVRLNRKYEQSIASVSEAEDLQTSYFNQLALIARRVSRQIMNQYAYLSEEVGGFVDSARSVDHSGLQSAARKDSPGKVQKSLSLDYHRDLPVDGGAGARGQQGLDSLSWKQLVSSIVDNTQNILVREHINTMLINFLFDATIRMLNPWLSLFYQASFIISSYLSIISFLLVVVAILVCFNTIPCFRNEKNEKKSKNISARILRIYKANVMVLLLNAIFILGGLLRYLYLPNEIELLNTNIAIIKAVNKVLNIILCPCVVNIITSFSTVYSIFQWQMLWIGSKLSLSSLINL